MTRREWAEQIIAKHERKDDWGIECVSSTEVQRLLLKEHARAVRIVQKIKRRHSNAQEDAIYSHGFTKACEDILKAIKEGRA